MVIACRVKDKVRQMAAISCTQCVPAQLSAAVVICVCECLYSGLLQNTGIVLHFADMLACWCFFVEKVVHRTPPCINAVITIPVPCLRDLQGNERNWSLTANEVMKGFPKLLLLVLGPTIRRQVCMRVIHLSAHRCE